MSVAFQVPEDYKYRLEGLRNGAVAAEQEALDAYFAKTDATLHLYEQSMFVAVGAVATLLISGAPWWLACLICVLVLVASWMFEKVFPRRREREFMRLLETRNVALSQYAYKRLEEFRNAD